MHPLTLWTPCVHVGSHMVDLTWTGAVYTLACFLVGLWLGRNSRRTP